MHIKQVCDENMSSVFFRELFKSEVAYITHVYQTPDSVSRFF